ncbi:sensor histidine kinase [Sulfuriferula thiophila]|uniref:sensor histidine kinase n=1 Tax=Sulfuriferula thiophila TaxID=1781211 RepID=UPI000F60FDBB|nr:histidine kinase [Sulfuriferula thiophila]
MPKPEVADYPDRLPDFCNLGVMLRILLGVEGLVWTTAWLQTAYLAEMWHLFVGYSVVVQASLLLTLVFLCLSRRMLQRLPYGWGVVGSMLLALLTTALVMDGMSHLFADSHLLMTWREAINVLAVSALLLGYFRLRGRALSPALTEARLQALQARIRPHFLFNSLNAVLSLVRSEPRRAERALENLADLFRVVMADNRQLSPLKREVEISRQYLELEGLRLGERLRVVWHIDKAPGNALVPPLLLQPLLENAVYHGIEPATQPGEITVNIYRNDGQLHLIIRNPYQHDGQRHTGNKMALGNIRSRLMLHFDVEASLRTQIHDNYYQVHIIMPYRTTPP